MPVKSSEDFTVLKGSLYVAAVSDVLDTLGYRGQVMHNRLRPLLPDRYYCGFMGRARTFRWMDIDYMIEEDPYGLEIEAMDALGENDVVVHSSDFSGTNAPWGELMSTVAKRNGCVGCVCDSQIRDCNKIIELNFPVYYAGIRPLDSQGRGRVMAYDVPVRCGDVLVHPGDLIFADFDGIIVIPRAIEEKALDLALEKVQKESGARKEILEGKTLRAVYDKYGVL
jgi:4-hydroxy-4-methyl-2-oxoglutarate aldolase